MLHLKGFYVKYHDWADTLASYNAGSPRKNALNGKYFNQNYVDTVLRTWAKFEKLQSEA